MTAEDVKALKPRVRLVIGIIRHGNEILQSSSRRWAPAVLRCPGRRAASGRRVGGGRRLVRCRRPAARGPPPTRRSRRQRPAHLAVDAETLPLVTPDNGHHWKITIYSWSTRESGGFLMSVRPCSAASLLSMPSVESSPCPHWPPAAPTARCAVAGAPPSTQTGPARGQPSVSARVAVDGGRRSWAARAVKSAPRSTRWTLPQVSSATSVSGQPRSRSSATRRG